MGRLRSRIARLEEHSSQSAQQERRSILDVPLQESGLTAPEWHCRRALAMATQDERDELDRLLAEGDKPAFLELWEEVLRREAPTLADDVRCDRDLLCRELDRLRHEWREQGRAHSTSYSDPAFWMVEDAAVNRNHAVKRGARLITDPDEVVRIIERITVPATTPDEMIELIEWRPGRR